MVGGGVGFPEWTRWAQQGSEHDFSWRVDSGMTGVGTLYVDGVPFDPRELVLDQSNHVDVTSYGDTEKTFIAADRGELSVGFPEGGVVIELLDEPKVRRHPSTNVTETRFRGRVGEVDISGSVAWQAMNTSRPMRDSPPSEDVTIPCVKCGEDFPSAEVSWASDPYYDDIFSDVRDEGWWCRDCFDQQNMET